MTNLPFMSSMSKGEREHNKEWGTKEMTISGLQKQTWATATLLVFLFFFFHLQVGSRRRKSSSPSFTNPEGTQSTSLRRPTDTSFFSTISQPPGSFPKKKLLKEKFRKTRRQEGIWIICSTPTAVEVAEASAALVVID